MKKAISILSVLITSIVGVNAQEKVPFWQNEKINEDNREPMHAAYYVFENEALAAKNEWRQSKNYLDINGVWKFKYVDNPDALPKILKKALLTILPGIILKFPQVGMLTVTDIRFT